MNARFKITAVLGTALLAFGCADTERSNTPLAPGALPSTSADGEQTSEKEALNKLTRAVALALQDQGLRQRIKNDLHNSRHTIEHKLPFSDYLHGQSGGILLAKMAKETDKSREEILALLDAIRPLEFYMPVDEHRESWTGGENLWVGSYLRGTGPNAVGYNLQGSPVSLSEYTSSYTAPAIPTLVLVQVETNFSDPLVPAKYRNKGDHSGETIGTWTRSSDGPSLEISTNSEDCSPAAIVPCDGGGSGGGGGGGGDTPEPEDRYRSEQGYGQMERMVEYKLGRHLESNILFEGDPELYVVVTSHANNPTNPSRPYFQSTIGFGRNGDDNRNWHRDRSDLIRWRREYGNYIHLKFYEADSADFVTGTLTFEGKTYGYSRPDENDDLGEWTYSFFDASLTTGYDGSHGVGKWGLNTGSRNITVITDYVTP